ncbi:class I SAM-dependent DNA methyltransferase [Roseofilum casamattae]|uniref:Class I SAM-dependent methyltransferase n=1 Tax=Roseofilum casamattae BLCC-M143 TaxID=3022442 RepID=A0ABT7BY76_9CYAN|nr:class I SAM-dependent methyltransferase [Roseofilum casamattae]MDJ1184151.1 class I SAM-dependent methyltransferase [Roseofilum casamattae BLCC-M143]
MTINKYDDIAEYYDATMTNGYYDYPKEAQSLNSILKSRKKLLEIGVGTGLLAEKLLELDPSYEITGIDFTPAMLDRSKARLGNRAKVVEGNVLSMNLQESFDCIYSHGGPAGVCRVGKDYHLYSFLPNFEDTVKMLNNIARHLVDGGWFVLNIQAEEIDADGEQDIGNGIVYAQQKHLDFLENKEMYFWETDYSFKKEGAILAKDRHKFLMLYGQLVEETMKAAGLKLKEATPDDLYMVYEKVI